MIRRTTYALVCALIAGCVSTTQNLEPEPTFVDSPRVGETRTVEVGLTLVEKALVYYYDSVQLKTPYVFEGTGVSEGVTITANPGYYVATRRDRAGTHYANKVETCTFGACTTEIGGFLLKDSSDVIRIFDGIRTFEIDDTPDWVVAKFPYAEGNAERRELVYNGRSGTTIRLVYQEFEEATSRPAVSQQLSYDLADDSIIGFEGVRIEVLEASNVDITYRVLNTFPDL